jgi:hypothetical protein
LLGEDSRLNGLTQSQKWPVGFGSSEEIVVWDQGCEIWDEEYPFSLNAYPPNMFLGWLSDSEEDEDTSLVLVDAFEDYHPVGKVARHKSKGKRELLNLKSSINYGDAISSSRSGKGKAHIM